MNATLSSHFTNLTGYGEECKEKILVILLLTTVHSRSQKNYP